MATVIPLWKASRFLLHLCFGLLLAIALPRLRLTWRKNIVQWWSAKLLQILNISLIIDANDPIRILTQGMVVTNHISWLDVFVLNAVFPMRFVAKAEVQKWPVIGWLCIRAQTLFIERGSARAAARMNQILEAQLREGECLAVFPEGTSTDGRQVAHFHASLLQPAIDAEVYVYPIVIRYQNQQGELTTEAAYIDDMSFAESLRAILKMPAMQVQLTSTTPLQANQFDRRNLSQQAEQQIARTLQKLNSVTSKTAVDQFHEIFINS
jgi:1-acyl-sn-glycerol-3-phosphate acyltransferase